MVSDYLAGLNASLSGYAGIIAQCENPDLRQTIQSLRNQDEIRQYSLFKIAKEKGMEDELYMYDLIAKNAKELFTEITGKHKDLAINVDFYSGFVYDMLGLPRELYTPIFAVARISGWSAHRIEELIAGNRVIRPAYKSVAVPTAYIPLEKRENNVGASSVYVPLDER